MVIRIDKDYPTRGDKINADLCTHGLLPWECAPCLVIMVNGLRREVARLEYAVGPTMAHDVQTCEVGYPTCQKCKDQMSEWW